MKDETLFNWIVGFSLILSGFVLTLSLISLTSFDDVTLSQETADDICRQLTGNETAIAEDSSSNVDVPSGKLRCVLPSFDSTQNIIIIENSEYSKKTGGRT